MWTIASLLTVLTIVMPSINEALEYDIKIPAKAEPPSAKPHLIKRGLIPKNTPDSSAAIIPSRDNRGLLLLWPPVPGSPPCWGQANSVGPTIMSREPRAIFRVICSPRTKKPSKIVYTRFNDEKTEAILAPRCFSDQ